MDINKKRQPKELELLESAVKKSSKLHHDLPSQDDIIESKQVKDSAQKAKEQLETQLAQTILELRQANHQIQLQMLENEQNQKIIKEQAELLDLVHDAILVRDLDNTIIFWNQSAEKMYGFPENEALAKLYHVLLKTQFSKPLSEIQADVLRKGCWEGELLHTKRDGTQIVVASRWVLRKDAKNQPQQIIEIDKDITAFKGTESALFAVGVGLAEILESAKDGIISLDEQGKITLFNQGAEKMFGYMVAEVIGKSIDLVVSFPSDGTQPIREFTTLSIWLKKLTENSRLIGHRKDGTAFPLEASTTQLELATGKIFILILRDITHRMQTEEALRDSESILRSFYNSAPMMMGIIQVLDSDILHICHNKATTDFFNTTVPGMQNRLTSDLGISKKSISQWIYQCNQSEKTGNPARFEYAQNTVVGLRWLSVTVCPIQRENREAEKRNFFDHPNLPLREMPHSTSFTSYQSAQSAIGDRLFCYIIEDVTERKRAEKSLQQANQKLTQWVNELEARNQDIILLGEMSNILQACLTTEEAYETLAQLVEPLFPEMSGAVFVISNSKQLASVVASWGDANATTEMIFTPHECWALRRGRPHLMESYHSAINCKHIHHQSPKNQSLCIPMMAQGEAVGVLYLGAAKKGQLTESKQQLAITVAEQIGLALGNLKLHEVWQQQSIRDPLTGLFNRRYLEESLEREISRAERQQQTVGIIMLDVDHFKIFNDTFGHHAGDRLLRELGIFLQQNVRVSDIACRYGGEEFLLILPEASKDTTVQRAEQIREGIKHLNLYNRHQQLGTITLSLGVGVFPTHGMTGEMVIQAADAALYKAKASGRDRVIIAG